MPRLTIRPFKRRLTDDERRTMVALNLPVKDLAAMFDVSQQTVYNVLNKRNT